ncbi:MAG: phytoene desaturase [Actinobacteria bacterium]|nr:phytoene desaturase [Actinomycetota bacterium]
MGGGGGAAGPGARSVEHVGRLRRLPVPVVAGHIVVVGAGLAGLSAACHLRQAGLDVTVVEAADVVGGRAGTMELGGYRFDTGPTVLTMPELVDRCFAAVGADRSARLPLRRVDPMYRACFADGSTLRVRHGRDAMAAEVAAVCGEAEADGFARFCGWLEALYRVEMPSFIERNYDSVFDLLRPLRPALELARLGALRRLAPKVGSFFHDERLVRLFSFQSLYAGLAPYEALALYGVITYMDVVNGVYIPEGGMHALPQALAGAAADAGVTFRLSSPVERIVLTDGRSGAVRGVTLAGGEFVRADAVVCSADIAHAYDALLPGLSTPRRVRRGSYSPSAVVWHVGVRGPLGADVEHHNIHFGGDWDRAFTSLLERGERMADPSLLVTVPSYGEPSMAPDRGNVLYVLEPVPNLDAPIDWARERGRARDDLAAAIERFGYPTDIEVEHLVDPTGWRAQGMPHGTPFALSHRFSQTGPLRPRNLERRAPGLFFAGASTVPGVGVPMVLISGMLAARRVVERAAG